MYQSNTTKLYYVYYCIMATCFDSHRICISEGHEDDFCILALKYGAGKPIHVNTWKDPEYSRKLRFLISAQEGGRIVSLTHRPHLPPRSIPGTHFC